MLCPLPAVIRGLGKRLHAKCGALHPAWPAEVGSWRGGPGEHDVQKKGVILVVSLAAYRTAPEVSSY